MMEEVELKQGDPIPGSRFFRAFCANPRCREPMRVEKHNIGEHNFCSKCEETVPHSFGWSLLRGKERR